MNLNPQQLEAVRHIDGPLLIFAGAGTGKTRVIVNRIAYMIQNGIDAGRILAVTFTNKAAQEMKERVKKMAHSPKSLPVICTFHSLCARILRESGQEVGVHPRYSIIDESDQVNLVKEILRESGSGADFRDMLSYISHMKNSPGTASAFDCKQARDVFAVYQERLAVRNCLDFDDLIFKTLELFNEHAQILEFYRDRYRYIMVDEYQDSNRSQFELVRLLAGKRANLLVVGDDDQSIYSWRGADIHNILEFDTHFKKARCVRLEQNYRSSPVVLKAANALIGNNKKRRTKALWTNRRDCEPITLIRAKDERDEARRIVQRIQLSVMKGTAPYDGHAILMRTNTQTRFFEEELRDRRIPYRVIGGMKFYDRKEIRDFLAYLRLAHNPYDDAAFLRIVNVPPRGIGKTTIQRLMDAAAGGPLFPLVLSNKIPEDIQQKSAEALRHFGTVISSFSAAAEKKNKLCEAAGRLIEKSDFLIGLQQAAKDQDDYEKRKEAIDSIIDDIAWYEKTDPAPSLAGYLERLSLYSADEDEEQEKNKKGVVLITIHSCKGLEFPHVFIAGVEEGFIPHKNCSENGIEEERRLLYVGMTRAISSLTISYAAVRHSYGSANACAPSRFLLEIPSETIREEAQISAPADNETAKNFFELMRKACE